MLSVVSPLLLNQLQYIVTSWQRVKNKEEKQHLPSGSLQNYWVGGEKSRVYNWRFLNKAPQIVSVQLWWAEKSLCLSQSKHKGWSTSTAARLCQSQNSSLIVTWHHFHPFLSWAAVSHLSLANCCHELFNQWCGGALKYGCTFSKDCHSLSCHSWKKRWFILPLSSNPT